MANDLHDTAIDRIRDQMAKSKNAGARLIGEVLTALLPAHPEWADRLADKGKTLEGAYSAMFDAAKKKNQHAMTDAEGLPIALKYFGIDADGAAVAAEYGRAVYGAGAASPSPAGPEPPQAPAPAEPAFDLDALLEGL